MNWKLMTALWCTIASMVCAEQESLAAAPQQELDIPDDGVRVSVLGYHDFSENEPETAMRLRTSKFRRQMEVLRELDIPVISMQDFIDWKSGDKSIPEKSVVITIDDGWKSVYTDAFPILKEFGHPFTLFLYKNYVDGGGKALTTPMINEMLRHGATIGSHSVSHPYPATVKSSRRKGPEAYAKYLESEMGDSKRFLESKFGQTVTTYAYPGGFFTEEMLELAPEIGYSHLFTVQPGKVRRSLPNNTLPRYIILGNYDKIFGFATTFRDAQSSIPASAVTGLIQDLPHPVRPEPGAIVNSRLPEISVDLSALDDIDPKTLTMRISGFGQVPANFASEAKLFSWQVNRYIRQPVTEVVVTWRDSPGKPPEKPLRWSFQIDREAAYLPEE